MSSRNPIRDAIQIGAFLSTAVFDPSKSHIYAILLPRPIGEPMGNIRPTYIKRIAIELVQKYPEQFTSDFQHNKLMVSKLTDVRYVAMRNKIAGYVTRYRTHYEA
jgi:small subunit ribosomal protein S17e